MAAAVFRSDLEIPVQVAKFLSLYLLFAIGFKGGVALAENPFDLVSLRALLAAIALSVAVPIYTFYFLRKRIAVANAAAIAATYGSVSAVTFVTATSYLDTNAVAWSGYLVAAMALMESPAIIVGVLLYRVYGDGDPDDESSRGGDISWGDMLREACFNGSVFLVLGSLVVGWITGPGGMAQVSPLVKDLFTGVLCLFLLDMGIVAARRLEDLFSVRGHGQSPLLLVGTAIVLPLVNAALAIIVCRDARPSRGRCGAADRAGGQRLLYCRSCRNAPDPARGQSQHLSAHVAYDYVSVQYPDWYSAVPCHRALSAVNAPTE